nr:hypothetical protein [Tanacetum cinerariifolium]
VQDVRPAGGAALDRAGPGRHQLRGIFPPQPGRRLGQLQAGPGAARGAGPEHGVRRPQGQHRLPGRRPRAAARPGQRHPACP